MTLYTAAVPYTAGRPRSSTTYRRTGGNTMAMRGLGSGTYWQDGPAIPGNPGAIRMTAIPFSDSADPPTDLGEMGKPYSLAVMYARKPLLWLFLLFGGGWLGGYLTWVFIGRRKR